VNASTPIVQMDRAHVSIETRPEALDSLRQRFAEDRVLRLPGFFSGDLLATVTRRLRRARFRDRVATRVHPPAIDLKLDDVDLIGLLHFVMNDAAVIRFVARVSGTEPTGFVGAVYRIAAGMGHRDSWHSDMDGNRLVALTLNLSEDVFEGGELELRERGTRQPLWRIANTGPGDALLFALGSDLEHRIRPMAGTAPKTAFAGWFCRDADLKL
jgi:hypothetical protein